MWISCTGCAKTYNFVTLGNILKESIDYYSLAILVFYLDDRFWFEVRNAIIVSSLLSEIPNFAGLLFSVLFQRS